MDGDISASAGIATSKISGFDTQVRTNRLDQMATPTADVSFGSKKITSLATPTANADAATKAYVDGAGAMNLGVYIGNGEYFATALASTASGAANNQRTAWIVIPSSVTITGVQYRVGGTSNGNVKAALYDNSLNKLAETTATVAQAAINTVQSVSFAASYAATPGRYYVALCFSSSTATFQGAVFMAPAWSQTNGSFAAAAPTGFAANNLTIPAMVTT